MFYMLEIRYRYGLEYDNTLFTYEDAMKVAKALIGTRGVVSVILHPA